MHGGGGPRLGGDADELAAEAAAAGLGLVALDTSCCTRTTCLGHAAGAGRRGRAAALLGRVVFVVGNVPPQQVLARKRLVANLAGEAAAERVCLDVPDEVLRAGVGAATVAAGIESAGMALGGQWRRGLLLLRLAKGQGRGRGRGRVRRWPRGTGARTGGGKNGRQSCVMRQGGGGVEARDWRWWPRRVKDVRE